MVILAEKMRAKLLSGSTSQATGTNDEEIGTKEEMQELLLSVGIVSPVTKESAGALYHQQLSRQVFYPGSCGRKCIHFYELVLIIIAAKVRWQCSQAHMKYCLCLLTSITCCYLMNI